MAMVLHPLVKDLIKSHENMNKIKEFFCYVKCKGKKENNNLDK
jgi:hypothetical protein